ncbi:redoxin domain-containing protein [Aspergillus ellipticus CBS 707.79]|uniref:thioredoxin-dependent peroxiredoxin n=1 Tax=Aspergillus ellipticus CBS 707.79 TaxID=1448320 RepID=A0A319D5G8_9EURO|nr:redoxin domain-containing protein [Aspergillus ellipticus CBS 707.79]
MAYIAPDLEALSNDIAQNAPDAVLQTVLDAKNNYKQSFNPNAAIKVGDQLPPFNLKDATGAEQTSTSLLRDEALIITFYRGEWCPFCNIAIAGLQKYLSRFKAKGANLVAITPELPNNTMTMTEKHDLKFPVLTDLYNEYARKLGIVWKQPESLRPVYKALVDDPGERNGDDSFEVPIPVTMLVGRDGVVRNLFCDPDYFKRVEPEVVLGWVEGLQG